MPETTASSWFMVVPSMEWLIEEQEYIWVQAMFNKNRGQGAELC